MWPQCGFNLGDDEPFQPNPSGILPPALKTAVDKRKQKFPGPAGVVGKVEVFEYVGILNSPKI